MNEKVRGPPRVHISLVEIDQRERRSMTEGLAEIRKTEQEYGAAQNALAHLVEATKPLGNTALTEALETALREVHRKGWQAQEELERAEAAAQQKLVNAAKDLP